MCLSRNPIGRYEIDRFGEVICADLLGVIDLIFILKLGFFTEGVNAKMSALRTLDTTVERTVPQSTRPAFCGPLLVERCVFLELLPAKAYPTQGPDLGRQPHLYPPYTRAGTTAGVPRKT